MRMHTLVSWVSLGCFAALADGNVSAPITLETDVDATPFWRTATNATFEVHWDFPRDAASASLSVSGMNFDAVYDELTDDSIVLALPEPTDALAEDVYRLTLSFDNGLSQEAVVGVVRGVSAGGPATCRCAFSDTRFAKTGKTSVLPVPAGALTLLVDGEALSTGLDGACGWYGLEMDVPSGTIRHLEYETADGEVLTADVIRRSDGMLIIFR